MALPSGRGRAENVTIKQVKFTNSIFYGLNLPFAVTWEGVVSKRNRCCCFAGDQLQDDLVIRDFLKLMYVSPML